MSSESSTPPPTHRLAFADATGATAVEYGLLVALIAVVILVGVQTLGARLDGAFAQVSDSIVDAGQQGNGSGGNGNAGGGNGQGNNGNGNGNGGPTGGAGNGGGPNGASAGGSASAGGGGGKGGKG